MHLQYTCMYARPHLHHRSGGIALHASRIFDVFYARDAMLARVLAVALCLCLYASVTSRCSIETAERIGLGLAWQLPSTYPVHCVIKKFGYLQNKDISIWNTAPNSGQWRWRMWAVAANFRRTRSPNRLAWSEGWRPPGAQSTFIK